MSKRAIWILAGVGGVAGVLALFFYVIVPSMFGIAPPGVVDGEISRRRVAIETVVAEGDREVRNVVQQECVTRSISGFNTGRYIGTHKTGEAPFAALPSGRAVLIPALFNCSGPAGVFDPDLPEGQNRDGRISVPRGFATLYDSQESPNVQANYRVLDMMRAGVEGVRIKEMKITDIPAGGELPETRASALPWFNHPPPGSPDYDKDHHLRNFQGHRLTVHQLERPCDGMAPDVSEPQLNTDSQFKPCRSTGGKHLGYLIGKPNADFSELQFSSDDATFLCYSVKYREAMLREKAPGKWRPATELSPRRYAWTPRLCIDGYCFRPEPSQFLVWTKYELYLPKSKRVVSIDPD